MTSTQTAPTYNLKAVIKETGLKADTLRAWERRYGVPMPERTQGGHRIYSQHDIDLLKWLIARQKEGLSISRAVDLWRRLEAAGEAPQLGRPEVDEAPLILGGAVEEMRLAWLDACLRFDETTAVRVLTEAFAVYPVETVCLEVIAAGLSAIGREWHAGTVSVQQEHFTSALAMRHLESLVAAAPRPTRKGRVLVGCAPDEAHTFSALVTALLLRRRGWPVTYLGASVPTARLEATVASTRPQLAIIAAQQLVTAANLVDMALLLRGLNVPTAYGGLIFNEIPSLRERVPGAFVGERFDELVPQVEALLASPPPTPPVPVISAEYEATLQAYRARRAHVEAHVNEHVPTEYVSHSQLANANYHLARNIIAALRLGDISLLGHEINWVHRLLQNHQAAVQDLSLHLAMYRRAVEQEMGAAGALIAEWLGNVLNGHNPAA